MLWELETVHCSFFKAIIMQEHTPHEDQLKGLHIGANGPSHSCSPCLPCVSFSPEGTKEWWRDRDQKLQSGQPGIALGHVLFHSFCLFSPCCALRMQRSSGHGMLSCCQSAMWLWTLEASMTLKSIATTITRGTVEFLQPFLPVLAASGIARLPPLTLAVYL